MRPVIIYQQPRASAFIVKHAHFARHIIACPCTRQLRTELKLVCDKNKGLDEDHQRQSKHLIKLEGVLKLLEQDKAQDERFRGELLGLSSRRDVQLDEAWAAIRRYRNPIGDAWPSSETLGTETIAKAGPAFLEMLQAVGWTPPPTSARIQSPAEVSPPSKTATHDLLTSVRLGRTPREAVLRYVKGQMQSPLT